jgi:hypothetical protein
MIVINWKGKIGYGDITSPICYAHNVSCKLNQQVRLVFHWPTDPWTTQYVRDPEMLWQRADIINSACYKPRTNVEVVHEFESVLPYNHSNYNWDIVGKDRFHNYWRTDKRNQPSSNIIVVNSTEGNVVSLKQYGKQWKDPAAECWPDIVDQLQRHYSVVVVDYRTPLHDMISLLRKAKGFVGYHGTAAWVARFIHTPSVLFADGGSLTRNAFFYADIHKTVDNYQQVIDDLDQHLYKSQQLIDKALQDYVLYKPSAEFINHLQQE